MSHKIGYLKIRLSCKASDNFEHTSANATPAKQCASCCHLTRPWHCHSPKNRQHLYMCCASRAKWGWRQPNKVLHLPGKSHSSCGNVAHMPLYCACHTKRLLRHLLKHTYWNVAKCHTCHSKRSYAATHSYATFETSKSNPFSTELATGTATQLRTVADSCERLQMVAKSCGQLRT